jgi:uroporphyrinogen-III decarboxylase
MRLAKEILGDVACIQGNVPSSMMQAASVDRLKAYCEELLEIFAGDGGFILANGCNIDKTTDEHVRIMIEVVRQQ